eukprot:CFRG3326T1
MTTRLDRLILLLDKGTSSATRTSAAKQIGEIQKNHPHELHALIARVQCLLKSKIWETRVAAAMAISELVKNVPIWDDKTIEDIDVTDTNTSDADGRLGFDNFDIVRVLERGHSLLGSSGKEYEYRNDEQTSKEKLELQKQNLIAMLELQDASDLNLDDDDMEDVKVKNEEMKPENEAAATEIADKLQGLSARERLRLKRLAKGKKSRVTSKMVSSNKSESPSSSSIVTTPGGNVEVDATMVVETAEYNPNEWPFETLCDELRYDLFDAEWEIRHGAGSALRDVIRQHGAGGGKVRGVSSEQNEVAHDRWLEDMAIRLLCIFALDKFSDFGSDQAVAPVRETCAQSLGALLPHMGPALVSRVLSELLHLLKQDKWEVRHGGLLGVKYILAVRSDLAESLLPIVLPAILGGLVDEDDDVRAVAAEAARPIVNLICTHGSESVAELLSILWDTLSDLDDLTASTSSVLSLLAELLSHEAVAVINERNPASLTSLVPRLFPFFRHSATAVRKATLRCLSMVITSGKLHAPTHTPAIENIDSNTADIPSTNILSTACVAVESTSFYARTTTSIDLTPTKPTVTADSAIPKWIEPIIAHIVRHLFQNVLLEEKEAVTELNKEVWSLVLSLIPVEKVKEVTRSFFQPWLTLLVTPLGGNFNEAYLLVQPKAKALTNTKKKGKVSGVSTNAVEQTRGPRMPLDPVEATRLRLGGCQALAEIALKWPVQDCTHLVQILQGMISMDSSVQRTVAACLISDWTRFRRVRDPTAVFPPEIHDCLVQTLHSKVMDTYVVPFVELEILRQRLRSDASGLILSFSSRNSSKAQCAEAGDPMVYNEDMAMHLCTTLFDKWSIALGDTDADRAIEGSAASVCRSKQMRLLSCVGQLQEQITVHTCQSMAALSECCVAMKALPPKLNPIIRPLMDSIKTELDRLLQHRSARAIAELFDIVRTRTPCPIPKITRNLCTAACADEKVVPVVVENAKIKAEHSEENDISQQPSNTLDNSIYTLEVKISEVNSQAGPGRKAKIPGAEVLDDNMKACRAQAHGGFMALQEIARYNGSNLFNRLPNFWPQITEPVVTALQAGYQDQPMSDETVQPLVNALHATRVVIPALDACYFPKVLDLLPHVINGLGHPYKAVRYMCANCVAVVCQTLSLTAFIKVIEDLLPLLNHRTDLRVRQGGIEAVYCVIDVMCLDVLPYLVFFMGPVLSRMTDQDMSVRQLSSYCFAALLRMMPLEAGVADPEGMPQDLKNRKIKEREFLELLADSSKITDVKIPSSINAALRPYQQEGVNWLCFLRQYGLHGVLGDDMGLGKTLQSICLMTYDMEQQQNVAAHDQLVLPHLVICPSTLVAHWFFEIGKFCSSLRPLMYYGSPAERKGLQKTISKFDVIIVSYDVVRNDIEFFSQLHFSYCILDEGHIIKNVKAKITRAVKSLRVDHRLILSGTPIQNNVLELWSLFDFLMPGFLGTERVFLETYSKPIMASRDAKTTAKGAEAGAVALEALHRQMLPFMMRRVKEDVLQDLPPKIIQDWYCTLSPLQRSLYRDLQESDIKSELETEANSLLGEGEGPGKRKKNGDGGGGYTHVFQALQYLRKLCTHPALVLNPSHPQWREMLEKKLDLHDIEHGPKLIALKQLLQDCGIGVTKAQSDDDIVEGDCSGGNHRVLIFCQHKGMLDIIENDLLKRVLPSVIYLRLDGSVEAVNRFAIVSKFNSDPTIDVLLLTTQVGGLGLNLTGADTVVFVEHDWNPMKDLQAMDRAHRIGQKKVVNVYRLITTGTLEEKVMGLQKFKLNIANSVITADNARGREEAHR